MATLPGGQGVLGSHFPAPTPLGRELRDNVPVDRCFMRAKSLGSAGDRQVASSHLEGVILANPDKDSFLVPYFPE